MLGHLTSLVRLKLNENSFTGEIPETFTKLLSIKEFYIQGNNMSITNDAGELRQDNEKYFAKPNEATHAHLQKRTCGICDSPSDQYLTVPSTTHYCLR